MSAVKSFAVHGVLLNEGTSGQAVGECFLCDAPKLYVKIDTGAWDCKVCGESGSLQRFLELKSKWNQEQLKGSYLLRIRKDRGLAIKTLRDWCVGWDGENYTIPVDAAGKFVDLRRYTLGGKVMATPMTTLSLSGKMVESDVVWICEGEWDGMALWEAVKIAKAKVSVVSVPGAGVFPQHSAELFRNKKVFIAFDNDEAGANGAARTARVLGAFPKMIKYVHWPENLPDGFDVRDFYAQKGKGTLAGLERLLKTDPPARATIDVKETASFDGEGLHPDVVLERYRKWLYLPDPEILHVIFGTMFANRIDGDPIWMFLVGAPGASKSEFLMSLSDAPLVHTATNLTPQALVSGANSVTGDPSLIPKLDGKVLIIKDFTTILDKPSIQRDEIFGILRDAYDGKTEKVFGNMITRSYKSSFGIMAGVTPAIEKYGAEASMLGERFMKYRIKQVGNILTGDALILRALTNIGKETRMREQLQQVAYEVLNRDVDEVPAMSDVTAKRIVKLAQWVSSLRGVVLRERYTRTVQIMPTREVGTRIAKQLAKFGKGVAIFQMKDRIDEDVYQLIVSVARSTIPDRVERLVQEMFIRSSEDYEGTKTIAGWCNLEQQTVHDLMADLMLLNIVQGNPKSGAPQWRLSRTVLRLMRPLALYTREESWQTAQKGSRKRRTARRRAAGEG